MRLEKEPKRKKPKKEEFDNLAKRPPGRRPNFEKKIASADKQEEQVKVNLETARQNQETVRAAKAEIGEVYHPYNLDSPKFSEIFEP